MRDILPHVFPCRVPLQKPSNSKLPSTGADTAAEGQGADSSGGAAAAAPVVDVYELADPVAILNSMPPNFAEDIEAAKWSVRLEAIEAVNKKANTPKLADGDYGDLVRTMKRVSLGSQWG